MAAIPEGYQRSDDPQRVPDGRPWSGHGPGPRKKLVARLLRPGLSRHHELEPPDISSFHFAKAVLEPIPSALYDCFEIGPRGLRDAQSIAAWNPTPAQRWRGWTNPQLKSQAEISPVIASGGQLSIPRIFDLRRMSLVFQPLLQWMENDHLVRAPYAEEGVLTSQLRADTAAIKAAGHFRLMIGIKDYLYGPLALLPQSTGITIPPQQAFCADVYFPQLPQLRYTWRVYVRGEGFLCMEIC